jgi:4-alpha-glucanotransferase
MTGVPEGAAVQEVIRCAHQLLAEAPAMVVTATLEDAMAVEEHPNLPTTTTEQVKWSIALRAPLEALQTNPLVHAIGEIFKRRRPPPSRLQTSPEHA